MVTRNARNDTSAKDRAPVGFSVELEELEDALAIDEHALEEALQRQPDLFYAVSKKLALISSQRDAAKSLLQTVEAETDVALRREALENQDKITEKEIESRKRVYKAVREANDQLLGCNEQVGQFNALKEAYQQRGYALKELVSLYTVNYYQSSDSSNATRGMRDRTAEIAKKDMNRQRRERS